MNPHRCGDGIEMNQSTCFLLIIFITAIIFLTDIFLPADVAIVIIIALQIPDRRIVLGAAIVTTLLVLLAYFLSTEGNGRRSIH